MALVGIVQKPLVSEQIYGFWTPNTIGSPFGPFVNKNHFAGWMLMALPVTLGLLSAGIARGLRGVEPTWRGRALWLSSPDASRVTPLAAAAAVMALSLVLTMSKSGISALTLTLTITAVIALLRQRTTTKRTITIVYLLLLSYLPSRYSDGLEQMQSSRDSQTRTGAKLVAVVGRGLMR